MTLQLGDTAPDFTAQTTEGELRFHDHLGDGWGILFSHRADFTPVCTTELGEFARRRRSSTTATRASSGSASTPSSHIEGGRPTSPTRAELPARR